MPVVSITVDCEAASHNRCFTKDFVKVSEEFTIPLTWLIHVSGQDPMSNMLLYHQEYLHRIPSWHEFGLHLGFKNGEGRYVEDPKERAHLIQMGKDVLKQCHVKPTAFRASGFALIPPDLRYLEDIGILVDSSVAPSAEYRMFVDWDGAPDKPYHPSYDDAKQAGSAKILEAPIATHQGKMAYLDEGWDHVRPIVEHHLDAGSSLICLAARDYGDCVEAMREAVGMLRQKGARFASLTQLASEEIL
ncbi:MAG: hypothetical protein HUU60_06195 [Armatimonadetes bacterium]|nr:hypothetical protein [Armatimonadota bacterium]